jgi:hypothetical protein
VAPDVAESITIDADTARVYAAVSDVRRMARWGAECFAAWVLSPTRFVGFNRRGALIWFTTCRIVVAEPAEEFAFEVTAFGMPVSRWGYRLVPVPGGTEVTEYWSDRRSRGAMVLGRVFTGKVVYHRPDANRENIRATLARLKRELERS